MTDAVLAQLRCHVRALEPYLGADAPARLKPLSSAYGRWLRQLVRVGHCAEMDFLAQALRGGDELLAAVEALHKVKAVAGMSVIRKAFAGVEALIDEMPMAEPGQEPVPDPLLDLPVSGPLAAMLLRVAQTGKAPVRQPAAKVSKIATSLAQTIKPRQRSAAPASVRKAA